jgi:FkbM family methyltransferase
VKSSEYLRRTLRASLPATAFESLSTAADWLDVLRKLPFDQARRLMDVLAGDRGAAAGELMTLSPTTLRHPFQLRPEYNDARSFVGTCIRSEYAPVLPESPPTYVVDAGAYIGDCSALILTRYPGAKLVALEPQSDAFRLAQKNLGLYPAAVVLHEALWSSEGTLMCHGAGIGASVSAGSGTDAVRSRSMESVLFEASFPRLDLFKCDIEDAEVEVFSNGSLAWLTRTERVLVELHSPEASRVVHSACTDAGLKFTGQYRSTHVFQRTSD